MSSPRSLPDDPRLADIARRYADTRAAIELYDAQWRLVWFSDEMKALLGEHDERKLRYGSHIMEAVCLNPLWARRITPASFWDLAARMTPLLIEHTPGGRAALADMAWRAMSSWDPPLQVSREDIEDYFRRLPETPVPPTFAFNISLNAEERWPESVECFHVRLHDDAGEFFGFMVVNSVGLPASLLSLLARGDVGMFERMARLVEPGRRQAAILFADLDSSSALARRLPSATYFWLISRLTTEIDRVVGRHGGVVGKHAGDGVSAFFIVDEVGSASAAARAAIETARDLSQAATEVSKRLVEERTGALNGTHVALNIGLHWGPTLYMGQLVTGGRLEVSALGDEVNECARIQDCAHGGEMLASKVLVEHLNEDDSAAVGVDPATLRYLPVAELETASPKAARDAGGIPVTVL